MAREIHDDGPTVEVVDYSDLRPCPPLPGPWPERVTARCVCCDDRMEVFIEQRGLDLAEPSAFAIPVDQHARLLAMSASAVGKDGVGGWLLIPDPKRGIEWVCRECAKVAIDFTADEVQKAVAMWLRWSRIEVVDKSAGAPRRWGRR